MEFKLNELQEGIRDLARDIANKVIAPCADEIERLGAIPDDVFKTMADAGLVGIALPGQYGGSEAGYLCLSIVLEEIAKVSASAATVLAVSILPLEAYRMYGTAAQKQEYLPDAIQGAYKGSFAFTEAGTGSDPKQLTTVAKQEGDHFVINGVKRFISNAAYQGPMVVFAREDGLDTCTAFIINKFCTGYSISTPWEKVGLRGSGIYDVFLDGVEVSADHILGERHNGFQILLDATTYGKLAMSAVFTGTMGASSAAAIKYAKEKLHRGKPIAKFPTVQSKISTIQAKYESARLLLYQVSEEADLLSDRKQLQSRTALVKGYVSDLAVEVNFLCMNILGSYGVTAEYQVERFLRDSLIASHIEGAADVQRLIAGSYILRN